MMNTPYHLHTNRDIQPAEFGALAALSHWGEAEDFTARRLAEHFAAVEGFKVYRREMVALAHRNDIPVEALSS